MSLNQQLSHDLNVDVVAQSGTRTESLRHLLSSQPMEFSSQSQVAKVLSALMLPSHVLFCEILSISRMGQIKNLRSQDSSYLREGLSLELKIEVIARERGKSSLNSKGN